MTVRRPERFWRDEAACVGLPLELFFGSDENPLSDDTYDGRAVCRRCPASRNCLLDALLTNERFGIRGGYLGHERRNALNRFGGSVEMAMAAHEQGTFRVERKRR
jgi:WhiB family redox-sensing transcriptional regulator